MRLCGVGPFWGLGAEETSLGNVKTTHIHTHRTELTRHTEPPGMLNMRARRQVFVAVLVMLRRASS